MPMIQETLALEDAELVVKAALARAEILGVACSVAVVDTGGHLLAFARRDQARVGTVELAINKAFSARMFDVDSQTLGELAMPGAELYGIQNSHAGRSVTFGGGVPVRFNGRSIGAIGVSGGSVRQDVEIAEAAIVGVKELEFSTGQQPKTATAG